MSVTPLSITRPLLLPVFLTVAGTLMLAACAHKGATDTASVADQPNATAQAANTPAGMPAAPAPGTPDEQALGEVYNPAGDVNTGTAVGQKVQELRADLNQLNGETRSEATSLQSLRASTQSNAADYFNTVAGINAKLQVGTTTGNPILVAQWNQAQAKLDNLSQDVGSLNALSSQIASSASRSAYILESVRATYGLSGAVDEDHIQLASLEDDVNRTVVLIDRLLNEISGDLNRQSTYVNSERRNLQTLALAINNGELYGQSLSNRPYMDAISASAAGIGNAGGRGGRGASIPSGRPLVVIRFDRENVNYQHAVYQAVSQALDRYPQASFDVVAVSPTGGNPAEAALATTDAKRNADGVARTLSQMGLPTGRIHMSATTSSDSTNTEVRIFVH